MVPHPLRFHRHVRSNSQGSQASRPYVAVVRIFEALLARGLLHGAWILVWLQYGRPSVRFELRGPHSIDQQGGIALTSAGRPPARCGIAWPSMSRSPKSGVALPVASVVPPAIGRTEPDCAAIQPLAREAELLPRQMAAATAAAEAAGAEAGIVGAAAVSAVQTAVAAGSAD